MAHEPESPHPDPASDASRRPRSTWIVLGLAAIFLVAFAISGLIGVAAWLIFAGLVVLLTAAYALILRRQTWARASDGKKRRQLLAVGGGLLVLGFVVTAMTVSPDQAQRAADDQSPSPSPTSPSASPSPTEEPLANQECKVEAEARSQGNIEYVCTPDGNGKLIWMDKESSEKLGEARNQAEEAQRQAEETRRQAEESQRQAEEAAAAEEAQRQAEEAAAVQEAQRQAEEAAAAQEAQRQAEEAAAVQEAQRQAEEAAAAQEAQRQAEEAAAAQEEQRQADEQARQQRLQQQEQPPANSFVYSNCTEVREAGAAPIRRGDYGWQDGLDGDGDGMACGRDTP